MRLSKIRLAGFKSFVDPITLDLSGNLTGVVGPNGCGKSNLIDAVLWVLGETSAKHLRGGSMADVIFNGSGNRKPVGQATVEIVFENADGGFGGQYASYAEVSVKRQVSRDGASSYFLNGVRCRRRDIVGLFLGTGLGARSYAVIEQGMISRMVEAKPEDLRVFLEEAAGISKYKERRHETEIRIRHARENLARLDDLRAELDRQLERLQQQARAAARYKRLSDDERLVKGQLLALSVRTLSQGSEVQERLTVECETEVEAALAALRSVEAELEAGRADEWQAREGFDEVQGRYYRAGAEIARLEQAIGHARERREGLMAELERAGRALEEGEARRAEARAAIARTSEEIALLEPRSREARLVEGSAFEGLCLCEEAMEGWQSEWDTANAEGAQRSSEESALAAHAVHLAERRAERQARLGTMHDERGRLEALAGSDEIAVFESRLSEAGAVLHRLESECADNREALREGRARRDALNRHLGELREVLATALGRLSSLATLQEAAVDGHDGAVREWLALAGTAAPVPLFEHIRVEAGWEPAVESVLGDWLGAFSVGSLAEVARVLPDLGEHGVGLIEAGAGPAPLRPSGAAAALLTEKIQSPIGLDGVLGGVYAAEGLDEALALRTGLHAAESLVTRDGVQIGPDWLRRTGRVPGRAGVIERQQEIQALEAQRAGLEAAIEGSLHEARDARETGTRLETEECELQAAIARAQEVVAGVRSELAAAEAAKAQRALRLAALTQEIAALEAQGMRDADDEAMSTVRLLTLRAAVAETGTQRLALKARRGALGPALSTAREAWRVAREESHALSLRIESLRTRYGVLCEGELRESEAVEQLEARCRELRSALAEGLGPLTALEQALPGALEVQLSVEAELSEARAALERRDAALREAAERRLLREREAHAYRERLEEARLARENLRVRLEACRERLAGQGLVLDELLAALPEDALPAAFEERLTRIGERLARLGAVNLAAMEEFEALGERKTYLDGQHADLTAALATLGDAIRRIDGDTRGRFKETFEQLDAHLGVLFPGLFGGGEAHLELCGKDLLETGVTVMARPPGKRNNSIHLLSGGEKALTALALVFALFKLHPAPFCLLDEVDAPLDDANAAHLCRFLGSMSEDVQFLFITHNKITMEIAHRLVGVTMQEPGVSRLVAVDVDEAVRLAATG
ncbi:MAG: chromosome segregation protein SMC [Gammaproteobacteria bacterium]